MPSAFCFRLSAMVAVGGQARCRIAYLQDCQRLGLRARQAGERQFESGNVNRSIVVDLGLARSRLRCDGRSCEGANGRRRSTHTQKPPCEHGFLLLYVFPTPQYLVSRALPSLYQRILERNFN